MNILTLILIFNDICCPSITGTTDTGGIMRGTEKIHYEHIHEAIVMLTCFIIKTDIIR